MSACIFCEIAQGGRKSEIVYESGSVVAFKDVNPQAAVHVLIIPKHHVEGLGQAYEKDRELIGHIMKAAEIIAKKTGVSGTGYRVLVNSGPDAGQVINHLHFHLLGGEKLKRI